MRRGPRATLLAYHVQPYASAQRERLLRALDGASLAKLARLDFELGAWLADAALAVIGDGGARAARRARDRVARADDLARGAALDVADRRRAR